MCRKTEASSPGKDGSSERSRKAHSLVAASSFHDWIHTDKDSEPVPSEPDITHYTPTQYFRSLRLNGTMSEIQPLREE